MAIFPIQQTVNNSQSSRQLLTINPLNPAPMGHYEYFLNFLGTGGPTTTLFSASQAIQCALMVPFYVQEQWIPITIDWIVIAAQTIGANTTTIAYNWIITDEWGKVVAVSPIVNNTALTVGLNSQTLTAGTFKPGTYYYGFSYTDNTSTSSTTSIANYGVSSIARQRIMGCKMWTYKGTGAQLPSAMTVGATCTLSIPTSNVVFGVPVSTIRCIA